MSKIRIATDVVALLTPKSVDRPWILYEAGVAKGRLDTTVFGLAVGIPLEKASVGPFAQFQNSNSDEDSITKLVMQLIKRNPEASPREEAVMLQTKAFLKKIADLNLNTKTPHGTSAQRVDETVIAKLFEEVKIMFRELPDKVEASLDHGTRDTRNQRSVLSRPDFAEELLFRFMGEPRTQAVGWLVFESAYRKVFPWLHEPGLELYRALRARNPAKINLAARNLLQTIDILKRTEIAYRMLDEHGGRRLYAVLDMLEHYLNRLMKEGRRVGESKTAD
jgi:hypothetical protein